MGGCLSSKAALSFAEERAKALQEPWVRWPPPKDQPTQVLGLDGSGKTSIMYMLKLGELVTTIPTIGFNVETVQYRGHRLTLWDIGGSDKMRAYWRHHGPHAVSGLIWVVDATDPERLDLSREALHQYMGNAQRLAPHAPLLVLANKLDLELTRSTACCCRHALAAALELCARGRASTGDAKLAWLVRLPWPLRQQVVRLAFGPLTGARRVLSAGEVVAGLGLRGVTSRLWHVEPCSAVTGEGLYDGIRWYIEAWDTAWPGNSWRSGLGYD